MSTLSWEDQGEALFNYVTSPQFAERIESAVLLIQGLDIDLEKEKHAMSKIWKRRDNQLKELMEVVTDAFYEFEAITGGHAAPEFASLDFAADADRDGNEAHCAQHLQPALV